MKMIALFALMTFAAAAPASARPNCAEWKCSVDCGVNNCAGYGTGWGMSGCSNFCNATSAGCGYTCTMPTDSKGNYSPNHREAAPPKTCGKGADFVSSGMTSKGLEVKCAGKVTGGASKATPGKSSPKVTDAAAPGK